MNRCVIKAVGEWVRRRTGIVTTPPPTSRYSKHVVWNEDSRPTGAEPPPEVEFGAQALAAARHLVEVHDYFRHKLAELRDVVRQVADGIEQIGRAREQIATITLRANAWALGGRCQAQCRILAEHHSMESGTLFPHLRRSQADLGAVLDRLNSEHDVIHGLLDDVDAALVRLAHEPAGLGPITAAVDVLTDALLSHFSYEERELVAPLARAGFYPGQL